MMTSKSILCILSIAALCLAAPKTRNIKKMTDYRFIVLGDRTGSTRPGIFPAVVAKTLALREKTAFYINVGDLIQGYTADTAEIKRQWEEVMAELKPVTDKYPMHYVPGNHDITDSLALPLYRRYAGRPYYSFDAGPDHFVVLDNSRGEGFLSDRAAQVKWLKKDLAAAKKARYTFCFYHKPLWGVSPGEKVLDTLHQIFKAGGVDYVINGHYHNYQTGVRDNIRYITMGSSGGATSGPPLAGNAYHYLIADVSRKGVNIRPVLLDGDTMKIDWIDENKASMILALRKPFWVDNPPSKKRGLELVTENPFKTPLSVCFFWESPKGCGQAIAPAGTLSVAVKPGKKETTLFSDTSGYQTACATLHAEYRWKKDSLFLTAKPGIRRRMKVARAPRKITADGELNEKTWVSLLKNAGNRFGNGNTAPDSTWVGMAYDAKNLYLAYLCYEKNIDSMPVVTPADQRDAVNRKEAVFRFYFGYAAYTDSFYQVHLNIPGALLDQKVVDAGENWRNDNSWNGVSAWKAKRLSDRWQGEVVIPWKALGMPGPGDFRFNCRRDSERETAFQEPYERHPKRFAVAVLVK